MKKVYKPVMGKDLIIGQYYYDTDNSFRECLKYLGCFTYPDGKQTYIFLSSKKGESKYTSINKTWAREIGVVYQVGLIPFSDGDGMYRETYQNT